MKHTRVIPLLSLELLRFVRDHTPTVEEFVARHGEPYTQTFHVLRKAGAIVVEDGTVRLSSRYLSPDGKRFLWGSLVFLLDQKQRLQVYYGPEGPPVFGENE